MKHALTLMVAMVLIVPVAALAGDYHNGATLNCSECHVMHGSQSHGYNSDGSGLVPTIGSAPPYNFLLRSTINELCLTCHNNQTFAPDVLDANAGTVPPNGRIAGALNRTNIAPYFNATGHTLGSVAVAQGGTFTNPNGLNCVDCHSEHGTGSIAVPNPYRNLSAGGNRISYASVTNDLTKDVFQRTTASPNHYDIANVDFNEPSPTASGYGNFCKGCHTNFHGSSTDANMRLTGGWLRHPTADANINISTFGARTYRPKVMSATGNWGTQGTAFLTGPATLTPSCFSCHAAHGNTNSFALLYSTGAGPIGESGNGGTMRETCRACHTQGS